MSAIIKIENLYKIYPIGKEKVVALGGLNLEKMKKDRFAVFLVLPVRENRPCLISWQVWKNRQKGVF